MDMKEIARDMVALGSLPFYAIVFIRAVIGESQSFLQHLLIALLIIMILQKLFDSNLHVARALVLVVFTGAFYKKMLFFIFAIVLYIFIMKSSLYLGEKRSRVWNGFLIGVVSSVIPYVLI